jgi:antitoxin (DNA-binding transcriptional repressor) of toxin-antitoxin stability system
LVKEAASGEEIVIMSGDTPLAKIVALPKRQRRQPGSARGKVWMAPDFDGPLEDFEEYM